MEKSIVCPQVPYLGGQHGLLEDQGNALGVFTALPRERRREGGKGEGKEGGGVRLSYKNQGPCAPFVGRDCFQLRQHEEHNITLSRNKQTSAASHRNTNCITP